MRFRAFGPTGKQVSAVGQGTWNMERDGREAAVAALRHGLDLGMTHVDTAEMYGEGKVEILVREAVSNRRDEVFLVSKVLPSNASRQGVVQACERSLRRLGTDHLDSYLLHWPSRHPLEDTLAAFEELRAAGKIRSWGLSNFDEEDLAEAIRIAGEGKIACNQVLYHLEERAIEHAVIPFCAEHAIAVVAYSPFGSGNFPGPRTPGGQVLAGIGAAHGATPHQVALAFLLRFSSLFVIPKAGRPDHAEENAGAAEIRLTEEEVNRIDQSFPRGRRKRGLPTL